MSATVVIFAVEEQGIASPRAVDMIISVERVARRATTHWIRLLPPITCRALLRPSLELLPPARMMEVMTKTPEMQNYGSIPD